MGKLHIYNGSAWVEAQAKVWNGSAWVGRAQFKASTGWVKLYPDFAFPFAVNVWADGQTLSVSDLIKTECFSGQAFLANGSEYEIDVDNVNGPYMGEWITEGNAADVWVEFVRTGGSTTWSSTHVPGTRYRLDVDRRFYMRDANSADYLPVSISGYFRLWDAASSGNVLDTGSTGTWSAELTEAGCPSCCFTPDTLVTMGDGSHKPIGEIRSGDLIRVENGIEKVDQVITRIDRVMYKIRYFDGRSAVMSEDHPVYIDGKGYAAINPHPDYKDLGLPKQLEVGDYAVTEQGRLVRLEAIEPYEYPGRVYTLSNSGFFAGGVLVY